MMAAIRLRTSNQDAATISNSDLGLTSAQPTIGAGQYLARQQDHGISGASGLKIVTGTFPGPTAVALSGPVEGSGVERHDHPLGRLPPAVVGLGLHRSQRGRWLHDCILHPPAAL